MKKLLIFLVILLGLIGLAIVLIPIFVDPNQYKEEIASEFKKSTGYDLEIEGDIELSIFPDIKVSVEGISVSNGSKTFADVKEVSAFVQLMPILSGKYQVDYINLVEPKLRLEKNRNKSNWEVKSAGSAQPTTTTASVKSEKLDLSLDDIRIIDGLFSYSDIAEGKSYEASDIDVNASLQSLSGPVQLDGTLNYEEEKITLSANIESLDKLDLNIKLFDLDVGYKGGQQSGSVSVKSDNINKALSKIGQDIKFSNPKLNLTTNIDYQDTKLALNKMEFTFGNSKGKGNINADLLGLVTNIESDLQFEKIILEDIIPSESASNAGSGSGKKVEETTDPKSTTSISLSLNADELHFKKAVFKKALVTAELDGKDLSLHPLYVELPGGGAAQIIGVLSENSKGKKTFDGKLEVNAKNLRKTLEGLEIDLKSIKPERLKTLYIDSKLFADLSSPLNIELSKIKGKIDNSSFNGQLDTTLTDVVAIKYRGGISGLDIDSYLVPKEKVSQGYKEDKISAKQDKLDLSAIKNFPVKLNLITAIGSLKYNGENFSNINAKAILEPGVFNAESFAFASRNLTASGKVKIEANRTRPRIDVEVNLANIDLANFEDKSAAGSAAKQKNKKGEAKWSKEPFKFDILKQFDAEFDANIASLKKDNLVLTDTKISGQLHNSKLSITNLESKSFGGEIRAKANFVFGQVPGFNTSFQAIGIDVYKFAKGVANIDTATGLMSISGNMESSGANQINMVKNLKGLSEIAGTNVRIEGFDVIEFAKNVININDPLSLANLIRFASQGTKETQLKSLKGSLYTENGVIQTNGIAMSTIAGPGIYKGYADLNKWYMDGDAEFDLEMISKRVKPKLGIRIFGPIDNPKKDIDDTAVKKYLGERAVKGLIGGNIVSERYEAPLRGILGLESNSGEEQPADSENSDAVETDSAPKAVQPKSQEEQVIDLLQGILNN